MITDTAVATKINRLMLDLTSEINESIRMVQERCPDAEFRAYRTGAAKILAEVLMEVLNPLHEIHPELRPWKEG